nr:zinc finger, CCHC-type [Tanacetum cinerariifolium]
MRYSLAKGTTSIVFYFGESPITWCTQKQPTVALSSCESEFMAATGAACQALWLKRLLKNGHINVEHVSGELQRADFLTKALPRLKFVTMRQMLGVEDLGQSNNLD